jgi:hypothetical protein
VRSGELREFGDPAYFLPQSTLDLALHAGLPRDVGFLIEIVGLNAQAAYGSAVMFPTDPAFTSRCTADKNNNDVQKAYQPWKP